ncbi:cupin domain-containing protein [Ralstonia solanacearum]|uniref:cupin domain-containing protein n=1 Tax=Ralstonia solanacearum TaxID=305 RepID=UPI001239D775|nr:cupin domain-containing protein [Ralstonia solanacearum]AYB53329.1 cupin domain-containing protein [Ralstonia solanacearum]AYB57872.1 cupin domain-containing protein [Ralstonia solanacearum]
MLVHHDFSQRVVVTPSEYRWVASPQDGVDRVMLDRSGKEQGRATSLVRYAAASHFPRHHHPGGEEILVLAGTFIEGTRQYPAGWYLRNPPGSSHQPSSDEGALLFVKLWQMSGCEQGAVRMDTRDPSCWVAQGERETCVLFASHAEQVSIERVAAGVRLLAHPVGGVELLVLDGTLCEGARQYERGTWMRLPPGACPALVCGSAGATVYLKTGHLAGHHPNKATAC